MSPPQASLEVSGFSTDSRSVSQDEVFFAFSQPEFDQNGFNGEFVDATRFVRKAIVDGASYCFVRKDKAVEHGLEDLSNHLLYVPDVIGAFQKLAHNVAAEWAGPVVGITGSAGKTTAKEITSHVLTHHGKKILKNDKNLNNGLGHPMTVLKLVEDDSYDIAVLEMGMSSPKKEIARLCKITPPDVSLVLNVLPVHVEHLGSIENVATAKRELVEGMKPGGTAILNADDPRVLAMKDCVDGNVLTFGLQNEADFSAKEVRMRHFGETHFTLRTPDGDTDVVYQLSGKHNILNALAASAVGYDFGMTALEIGEAISSVRPPRQRGEILRFTDGFTVINDSYNSNPDALLKMVDMVVDGSGHSSRTIVLAGEMLELGENESEIHRETGEQIAKKGIDVVVGVRGLAKELVEGVRGSGAKEAIYFETPEEAGEFINGSVKEGDLILVKGSRGVRTEKAIEVLTQSRNI